MDEFEVRTGVAHLCSRNTLVSGLVSRKFKSPALLGAHVVLYPVAGVNYKREQLKDFTPLRLLYFRFCSGYGCPDKGDTILDNS